MPDFGETLIGMPNLHRRILQPIADAHDDTGRLKMEYLPEGFESGGVADPRIDDLMIAVAALQGNTDGSVVTNIVTWTGLQVTWAGSVVTWE